MILQTKLENRPYNIAYTTPEKKTESLAIPGQAFNLKIAMEQYKRGSLIERVKGYYETEGMTAPDFNRMDRIEKLEALANYRKMREQAETNIRSAAVKAKAKSNEILEKQKQKAGETGKQSGDTAKPPDAV